MLGVDLTGGDSAKHLGSLKKANSGNMSKACDADCKDEDGEEIPPWQEKTGIHELHVPHSGNESTLSSTRYVPTCGRW